MTGCDSIHKAHGQDLEKVAQSISAALGFDATLRESLHYGGEYYHWENDIIDLSLFMNHSVNESERVIHDFPVNSILAHIVSSILSEPEALSQFNGLLDV